MIKKSLATLFLLTSFLLGGCAIPDLPGPIGIPGIQMPLQSFFSGL